MNDFVKLDIARETLNVMIAHYSKKGFTPDNKVLKQLLEDEKLFRKNDPATIDKILSVYAPMVRENKF